MDWIKANTDKVLLSCLFLTVLGVIVLFIWHGADGNRLNWLENVAGQVLAALLTLMVGRSLTQRKDDSPTVSDNAGDSVSPKREGQ